MEPEPADVARRAMLYEYFGNGAGADPAKPVLKALRTPDYKLILNLFPRDADELYDLRRDPGEKENLAERQEGRATLEALRRQLLDAMRELGDPALAAVERLLKKGNS